MEPLLTRPFFTHQVWGGDKLRDLYGKDTPATPTGESWEACVLPEGDCRVANGAFAGQTLAAAAAALGPALLGRAAAFSLLVKLIDASDRLSVQVHPDDAYALSRHGEPYGKTEAWVVLQAEEGARLVYGVDGSRAELQAALQEGGDALQARLRFVSVAAGDTLYIPAGCVHAIGAGIVVYEVQQSSNRTYRLYDWGRPRETHVPDALAVMDPLAGSQGVLRAAPGGAGLTTLVRDGNFTLQRAAVSGELAVALDRFHIITSLGDLRIGWAGGEYPLPKGKTVVAPAALCGYALRGKGEALISFPSK